MVLVFRTHFPAYIMSIAATKPVPLLPILSVNFIGTLGYSIVMPFLVFLVHRFGGNEFLYGVLGSIYPAFQFFGAPILGKWSDSIGRRRVLLISQVGTLVAWVVFLIALFLPVQALFAIDSQTLGAFSISLPLVFLFIARALDGLTGGNVSVANAYLSDISTEDNRKANFGKMAMSSSLGFIIGPTLAGLLGATQFQEALPVVAATLISIVAVYLIQYRLPESKANLIDPSLRKASLKRVYTYEQRECYKMKKCTDKSLPSVTSIPYVPYMLVIYFLTFLGFSFFYAAFPMHALKQLEWSSLDLGFFFTLLSGLMIVVQGPLLGYLSDKINETTLVLMGSLFLAANFYLMTLGNDFIVYLAAGFFALGNGLMWPSYLSVLSKLGGEQQQGSVQGVANSAGSLASILGLICGGFLYGQLGSVIFLATAAVFVLVFFLSFRMKRI